MASRRLSRKESGDVIHSEDWDTLNQVLYKIYRAIDLLPAYIRRGDKDTVSEYSSVTEIPRTIYLLDVDDWDTARDLITDYSLIFIRPVITTVSSSELYSTVSSKKAVAVVMIDTEPYYPTELPAFYPWFYTVVNPYSTYCDDNTVVDEVFMKYLGSSVPSLWDYFTPVIRKTPASTPWAVYPSRSEYTWSLLVLQSGGGVVEVPYDGVWKSSTVLEGYLRAISERFWGIELPLRIIHITGYVAGAPYWHEEYPFDYCWAVLADRLGYTVVDLRKPIR